MRSGKGQLRGANVGGVPEAIPVIGEPIAFGIGFAVLVLVAFGGASGDALVTLMHEGGHMLTDLLTGRGVEMFTLEDKEDRVDGATTPVIKREGFARAVIRFSGYPAPPLAGLGGAYVIADGSSFGVLLVGIVLLAAALLVASGATAVLVTLAALAGVVWAALAGSPTVQAAVAVGLVWLLLIGGVRRVLADNGGGDGEALAAQTWIPIFVWFAIWLTIAVVSLWVGGRILLGY